MTHFTSTQHRSSLKRFVFFLFLSGLMVTHPGFSLSDLMNQSAENAAQLENLTLQWKEQCNKLKANPSNIQLEDNITKIEQAIKTLNEKESFNRTTCSSST